jgi:hypothetical protein
MKPGASRAGQVSGRSSEPVYVEPPHREMMRIAEQEPDASLLQVIERIDPLIWQIETIPSDQKAFYARANGLAALRLVQRRLDRHEAEFALNAPPRTRQWLATGVHLDVPDVLSADMLDDLGAVCDSRLAEVGTPPVRVFDHPELAARLDLPGIVAKVLAAAPDPLPASARPAILKKRTLLRRTFPPSRLGARVGNSNNQLWHQDSNVQFNDRPMLTLWIPLQSMAEGTRPGLEILDAPVAYFSAVHGDYSRDLPILMAELFPRTRITSVRAGAGICVAFNGLTFHQTHATPEMTEHRDALLIRVLDADSALDFAPDHAEEDVLVLG